MDGRTQHDFILGTEQGEVIRRFMMKFNMPNVYVSARRSFKRSLGLKSTVFSLRSSVCDLQSDSHSRLGRKDGVAVIIVLGLLGLLMVLGVSFTVMMRGERAGAANYLGAAMSRHLAWAALSRAMDDINGTMSGDIYPPGDYLVSGHDWNEPGNAVALLNQDVRKYLPDIVLDFIDSQNGGSLIRSSWITTDSGSMAYIVVNLSDMLDVNTVGGADRAGGESPAEIALERVLSPTQENQIIVDRQVAPFDTLKAFRDYYETQGITMPADYFVTYSRFLPEPETPGITREDISGAIDDWATPVNPRYAEIGAAISQLLTGSANGLSNPFKIRMLFSMFQYLDPDYVPGAFAALMDEIPNYRKFPMINEIAYAPGTLQALYNAGTGQFGVRFRLDIETWFPFVAETPLPTLDAIQGQASITVRLDRPDGTPHFGPVTNVVPIDITTSIGGDPSFLEWQQSTGIQLFGGIPPTTNNLTAYVNVDIHDIEAIKAGVSVGSIGSFPFEFDGAGAVAAAGGPVNLSFGATSYEVDDPRLGFMQERWTAITNGNSIGTINGVTDDLWAANPRLAFAYPAYTSNAGEFYSPLELGNLLVPVFESGSWTFSPWETVRVFDSAPGADDRHPILDYFTVHTNAVRRGLVNVNTFDLATLQFAFDSVPVPGPVDGTPVGTNASAEISQILMDYRESVGAFQRVDQMLDANWRQGTFSAVPDYVINAMAAYTAGLLGVRQNLFLIVSTATEGQISQGAASLRGRNRALALVWRDPVANAEGLHDQFIQYFTWLD